MMFTNWVPLGTDLRQGAGNNGGRSLMYRVVEPSQSPEAYFIEGCTQGNTLFRQFDFLLL